MEVLKRGGKEVETFKVIKALDAVSVTTTSDPIVISGAKKITWFFTRTNHAAGSTAFDITVSGDGTTYVAFNKLISNVTNTNAQTLTRVASVSLAANGTTTVSMDLDRDTFYAMKVTATETTDGNHTATCVIEY